MIEELRKLIDLQESEITQGSVPDEDAEGDEFEDDEAYSDGEDISYFPNGD